VPAAMSSHLRRRHACHYSCSQPPLWGVCLIGAGGSVRRTRRGGQALLWLQQLHLLQVSILLPKTSQIILDKVVVLDKGTASVNAPPPLHRKIAISYRLSVTHTQP
jgi:hypothetical protein